MPRSGAPTPSPALTITICSVAPGAIRGTCSRIADARPAFDRSEDNGFRLVTYGDTPARRQLTGPIAVTRRDFRAERPVSDQVFTAFRGVFAYDPRPLDANDRIARRERPSMGHRKSQFPRGIRRRTRAGVHVSPQTRPAAVSGRDVRAGRVRRDQSRLSNDDVAARRFPRRRLRRSERARADVSDLLRHVREERGPDQRVAEPDARLPGLDDPRGQRWPARAGIPGVACRHSPGRALPTWASAGALRSRRGCWRRRRATRRRCCSTSASPSLRRSRRRSTS